MRRELDRIYVVRIWYEPDRGEGIWRASILDVHSKERRSFADFQALIEFLGFVGAPRDSMD